MKLITLPPSYVMGGTGGRQHGPRGSSGFLTTVLFSMVYGHRSGFGDFKFPDEAAQGGATAAGQPGAMEEDDLYS